MNKPLPILMLTFVIAVIIFSAEVVAGKKWVMVKDTRNPYNDIPYIKRPYHNPNLLNELKEKKKEELLSIKINEDKEKALKQDTLNNDCINFYRSKRINNFYLNNFGMNNYLYQDNIEHFQIQSRKKYTYKDFKNTCRNFYSNNSRSCMCCYQRI